MAKIQNDDCLLVGRDGVDYRISFEDFAARMKIDIGKSLLDEAKRQMQREILGLKSELAIAKQNWKSAKKRKKADRRLPWLDKLSYWRALLPRVCRSVWIGTSRF